jgi:hypothetical protein
MLIPSFSLVVRFEEASDPSGGVFVEVEKGAVAELGVEKLALVLEFTEIGVKEIVGVVGNVSRSDEATLSAGSSGVALITPGPSFAGMMVGTATSPGART